MMNVPSGSSLVSDVSFSVLQISSPFLCQFFSLLFSILPPSSFPAWLVGKNNCSANAVILDGAFVCLGHGKWLGNIEQSNIDKEVWVQLSQSTFCFPCIQNCLTINLLIRPDKCLVAAMGQHLHQRKQILKRSPFNFCLLQPACTLALLNSNLHNKFTVRLFTLLQ